MWRRRCLTHSPTPIVPPPFTLARRSRRRAAGTSRCQRGQRRRLAYNLLALGRNALSPLPLSLAASATNRMAAPRAAHARRTRHYQYHRLGLLATFRRCSHHSPPQHSGWRCAPSLLAASERAASVAASSSRQQLGLALGAAATGNGPLGVAAMRQQTRGAVGSPAQARERRRDRGSSHMAWHRLGYFAHNKFLQNRKIKCFSEAKRKNVTSWATLA